MMDNDSSLTQSMANDVLSITESHIKKLGEILGVATQAAEDSERRHAKIAAANMKISELESMLGKDQDPAQIQMALNTLADQLDGWWDLDGFGHISDISFGRYSCKVDFSCSLYGTFPLVDSPTPLTDKEKKALWEQSLTQRGFVLFERGGETRLMDCEKTRQGMRDLFATRLPSAKISAFVSHETKNVSALRSIEVYIHKIEEIKALPVSEKTEDN
jgi:hypothetical protein